MAEKKNKMLEDIDEITSWLEMRNAEISKGKTDVVETHMPTLARVICGGEKEIEKLGTEDRKRYSKYFKDNKAQAAALTLVGTGATGMSIGAVASGVGAVSTIAGLGAGGAAIGLSTLSGWSAASLGATAFVPALWPIGISMLAISAGSMFAKAKKDKEREARSEKLEKVFNKSHTQAQKCNNKIKANNKKIKLILASKIKKSIEALSDASKKIAINIDDALNADQNLRIMQYQEIVLKQYNSQNEIRKMLSDLVESYNKLVAENEQLASQVAAYEANMRMCGCTSNLMQ